MPRKKSSDPITAYAHSVANGKQLAGRLVRLACERHLRDLKTGHERGLWFDPEAADRIIGFFSHLHHSKGEWANSPVTLQPWEEFIVGSLMGWKREDGRRRFRLAYCEIARKNGKSTIAAGLGLYLLVADKEGGAEVYIASTKREQSKIVWDEAARMRDKSPALRSRVGKFVNNLHVLATASKMEPLGADADTMDGLNPHGVIIDELHAHKTRRVVDVMETAFGARRQPIQFEITTAGFDRQSVCWERHEYVRRMLEGEIVDDTVFGYIAALDPEDDWADETLWVKANPNLGISVKLDYLQDKCHKALRVPGAQNGFKRLHCNLWTESEDTWLSREVWNAAQDPSLDLEDFEGEPCWIGVDLSSRRDLTAMVMVFKTGEVHHAFPFFWAPADGILEREDKDGVGYRQWRDAGHLQVTPGPVVDVGFVADSLARMAERFHVKAVTLDAYRLDALRDELDELGCGIELVSHPQGYRKQSTSDLWMPGSVTRTEELLLTSKLKVKPNPILTWNVASVVMVGDAQGNLKPEKRKSTGRIDGAVALIQAVGVAATTVEVKPQPSFRVFALGAH